ncbi:hypothetical protein ACFWUW_22335 [Streptomyces sp. NPDC058655]
MGDVHAEVRSPAQEGDAELVVADDGEQGGPGPRRRPAAAAALRASPE